MSTSLRAPLRGLRFRQVHLDFHNNGDIPGIGAKFDKRKFQDGLKRARVDSITCFAKCHHGWSYHPTKVGAPHPHLKTDLLARQVEACREIGVRVPIYLSAGIDERMAALHPDWVVKHRDGKTYDPFREPWFRILRWNSPYLDHLCAQIAEVAARWKDADGIFLDICWPSLDYSEPTLREMRAQGLDPEREADARAHAFALLDEYHRRATAAARSQRADMPVFHNSGHVAVGCGRYLRHNSHLELESLPTGEYGYDHFPLSARYAATTGFEFLGMTGKFHTTWGEFGGFKRPAALKYECEAMIAHGARCSVGDQLHPSGRLDPDTYRLIGHAYRAVEEKEPWCRDAVPVARIGLFSAERNQHEPRGFKEASLADQGAARMLQEAHLPYLVLDQAAAWEPFDLVILPDDVVLEGKPLARAGRFLARGGKILASGTSLLDAAGTRFVLDAGVRYAGRSAFDPDYLVAAAGLPGVPVRSPVVIHGGAVHARVGKAEVLARRAVPYFNRTWRHFNSHQHFPDAKADPHPGATLHGPVAWFAHRIFTRYRLYGQPLYRDFVVGAIRRLLGALPVETGLPSTGRVNVMRQAGERRYVVHLLHAAPTLRGSPHGEAARAVEVIEEVVPLYRVRCAVRVPKAVRKVRLAPQGTELPFRREGGAVAFEVPVVDGHQMVELAHA